MTVRNWRYFGKDEPIGLLKITNGQFMTGNILGIIAEKKEIQNEKGHLLNAKSFDFPVRIKFVESYTGENFDSVAQDIREKLVLLEQEGCRCVITTGGILGVFDKVFHESELLALSSPLSMLDFVAVSIASSSKICIVNELSWDENQQILEAIGISDLIKERCIFGDMTLRNIYDCNGTLVCNEKIGAYVWDSPEDFHDFLHDKTVPIYTAVKIARLMKNVVAQIPYEGVI